MFPPYLGSHLRGLIEEKASKFHKINSEDEAMILAGNLGIEVWHWDFRKVGALFFSFDNKFVIGINRQLPEALRTKSLLHEIGHYILHHDNYFVLADHSAFYSREEKEADYFAWCLMSETLRERYFEECREYYGSDH